MGVSDAVNGNKIVENNKRNETKWAIQKYKHPITSINENQTEISTDF